MNWLLQNSCIFKWKENELRILIIIAEMQVMLKKAVKLGMFNFILQLLWVEYFLLGI